MMMHLKKTLYTYYLKASDLSGNNKIITYFHLSKVNIFQYHAHLWLSSTLVYDIHR